MRILGFIILIQVYAFDVVFEQVDDIHGLLSLCFLVYFTKQVANVVGVQPTMDSKYNS